MGHLQHDFGGMFLHFRGGGREPCLEPHFCCALSLSSLEQLMASVRTEEANVLHGACWKCGRELPAVLLEALSGYILFSVTALSEAPSLSVRTEVLSCFCAKTQARSGGERRQSSRHSAQALGRSSMNEKSLGNLPVPVRLSESHISRTPGCPGLQPPPVTGNAPRVPQCSSRRAACLCRSALGVAEQRGMVLPRG